MPTEKMLNRFYSTRSAIEHPIMLCPTIGGAIAQAERKLFNNDHDEIYIVQVVKVVRRHIPKPQYDLFDVK